MKKAKIYGLVVLFVILMFNISYAVENGGGESDPLISQSYLEMRLDQVKTYFEDKINNVSSGKTSDSDSTGQSSSFEAINIKAGSYLIGGAGTEMILRTGYAKAIANSEGGIVDITAGLDIQNGKDIPRQHLLVIPRDDGRGLSITAKSDAVVMIKGSYKIQ